MARINLPPVTRVLVGALIFQSVLGAAVRYRHWVAGTSAERTVVIPYLTLVPQLSIVYPWTIATTSLVESNIFTLSAGIATLFYGGRYLERAWSSRELAKYMAIVTVVPNLLTAFVLVVLFALSRNEAWTLTTVAGTVPIQIGFLVAFAQLIPAHTVTLFRGIISLRVVRFPLAYVGVVTLLSLTPLLSGASFLLALSGFLTSWTYLRFYKTVFPDLDSSSQSPSLRGDASETFAFAEFFPAPVRPAVATAADSVFDLLVQARLCTPFSPADVSAARGDSANSYLQRGTPGTARAEAERRRAIALRALDQRLNAASASGPGPSSASAGNPSASNQSPAATAGPSADTKTQTATTSKPGEMLGETKFEPDDHEDHGATKS